MAKQISFIHAADLHLDSPFKGLAQTPNDIFEDIRESTFKALDNLVQTAIDKKVDFVLIVGDLFDNEKQSLKAQIRLRKAFEKLKQHHIFVYLSYGNHDFINGNIHPVTYPDNVFIFPGEEVSCFTFEKNEEMIAAIYGFSYETRAVTKNKVHEFNLQNKQIPFHIAMLHGSVETNTDHDTYAPFQKNELADKEFQYWALGHIHQREKLHIDPPIVYPGNIQGRNRKETGEKGCYHVVLTESDVTLNFVPLQAIQFLPVEIDVTHIQKIHRLEKTIQQELGYLHHTGSPVLIDLNLISNNQSLQEWEQNELLDEIIQLINDESVHKNNWLHIFRCHTQVNNINKNSWKGEHFFGELDRRFTENSIQPYVKELYQNRQTRKFIDQLSTEEEAEIKTKAQQLLIHELLKDLR